MGLTAIPPDQVPASAKQAVTPPPGLKSRQTVPTM